MSDEAIAHISDALAQLDAGHERSRRLLVRAGDHWQVLALDGRSKRGAPQNVMHLSAKSARLTQAHKLSTEAATTLRTLGFSKGPGMGDWRRDLPRRRLGSAPRPLAAEILKIARELHGIDAPMRLDLEIDDRTHPENPELIAAMRKLATPKREEVDRHAMYNAMCNASFLVLADPSAPPSVDPQDAMLTIGELSGRKVYAAFTDVDALQHYDPLAVDYLPFEGRELFELLEALDAGSVQINPHGIVGGELYAHEISALAEGVRRFLRAHSN